MGPATLRTSGFHFGTVGDTFDEYFVHFKVPGRGTVLMNKRT